MIEISVSSGGIRARIYRDETLAARHGRIVSALAQIDPPFGLKGKPLPPPPPEDCGGKGDWHCGFTIHDRKPVITDVTYITREGWRPDYDIYRDDSDFDDVYSVHIFKGYSKKEYIRFISEIYPQVIEAFEGYTAHLGSAEYDFIEKLTTGAMPEARGTYTFAFNERWEIGYLEQVQFWDGLLCRRLFDISAEEVIRRLEGKVPFVRPLLDGVYVVFNDKMEISFDEFYEMNEYFQDLLGYTRKRTKQ